MKVARVIIGLVCIAVSMWMFLSGELSENLVIPTVVLIIGIIVIAVTVRKR